MKNHAFLFLILVFFFNAVGSQTTHFGFETATDQGDTITETVNGITVTASGDPDLELFLGNSFGGTTDHVVTTVNLINSVTFTFNQPVAIHSILPIESYGSSVDYTFTPTGGSNLPVTRSLILGVTTAVNLNWVNVTSFTVTASSAVALGFDDLLVSPDTNGQTFFEWETAHNNGGTITETVNGIGVTVSGDSSYALTDYAGVSGTSGNVILSNGNRTAITFTFDQPVVVNSILALEGSGANIDYTFTPTGGNNLPVTKALVSGAGAVSLNWIDVTSFTVTSLGGAFGFDNLSVMGIRETTVFDFETNTVTTVREECAEIQYRTDVTIDDITATFIGSDCRTNATVRNRGGAGGTTDNIIEQRISYSDAGPFLVTFSQPVVVKSLLPYNWQAHVFDRDVDFTFIPTGGNNSPVTVTLTSGISPTVNLNWINVTSFTVTPSWKSWPAFDNLSVNALVEPESLGVSDGDDNSQRVSVYPNPVENTLNIKNISGLKSISVYDLLGQLMLNSGESVIDVSGLAKGMYLLQIDTSLGIETKKIIKK